jgi:hypothetical protein
MSDAEVQTLDSVLTHLVSTADPMLTGILAKLLNADEQGNPAGGKLHFAGDETGKDAAATMVLEEEHECVTEDRMLTAEGDGSKRKAVRRTMRTKKQKAHELVPFERAEQSKYNAARHEVRATVELRSAISCWRTEGREFRKLPRWEEQERRAAALEEKGARKQALVQYVDIDEGGEVRYKEQPIGHGSTPSKSAARRGGAATTTANDTSRLQQQKQQKAKQASARLREGIPLALKGRCKKQKATQRQAQTSVQVATWNVHGYGTHEIDTEAEGAAMWKTLQSEASMLAYSSS